jgi:xanthine dehydrogenase accessory factor
MKNLTSKLEILQRLNQESRDYAEIWVVGMRGSNPTEIGAQCLITSDGIAWGTVGGGKIEAKVIETAKEALNSNSCPVSFVKTWNLQKDIGMSCGGEMTLAFSVHRTNSVQIQIFGAGHVSKELCHVLTWLNFRVHVIDPRSEWLDRIASSSSDTQSLLKKSLVKDYADALNSVHLATGVILVTQGHSTDLPLLNSILRLQSLPKYVGVIGSQAKRVRLERELIEMGVSKDRLNHFECPMGLDIGTSQPREIALSVAARILQVVADLSPRPDNSQL